ncbi:hypothetical protein OC25_07155 [Pedobacter kyungheensis]|uniref:Glycosyltransferase 2-like domain-containing protein n=1 Tax=Pedobacter kyungheensis TaxID=1069985 RepID=A0A0C1G4T6_9SPHI|nr:hypothetical protein [Pedobacter kyungheensis]KIA95109.1 hypothetical protein OC25_07155 [Pedobacter kyungheensis]
MIAIVSSCLYPEEKKGESKRSHFTREERERQTISTLRALENCNFSQIILVDNSVSTNLDVINSACKAVQVIHVKQYQFINKGINEFLMLLAILDILPENEPIFKISARYLPNENFKANFDEAYDFKVKPYHLGTKSSSISTRGYFVRNKHIYEDFLLKTLNETFSYEQRVVGIRSLINFVKQFLKPVFNVPRGASVEFAGARVLKYAGYHTEYVDKLGISGTIAGFENKSIIEE